MSGKILYKKSSNQSFNFIQLIFYFSVLFPYISIIPVQSDTQINAFLVSFFLCVYYLLFEKGIILNVFCFSFLAAFFAFCITFSGGISFIALRSFFGYASIPTISLATFFVLNKHGLNTKLIKIAIWLWLIGGILQFIVSPNIFQSFIGGVSQRVGIAGGRGVSSFAVEPTYYGTICLFLALISIVSLKEQAVFYAGLCIFQVVFFAKSSMIILIVVLGCLVLALMNRKFSLIIITFLVISTAILLILFLWPDSRMSDLIKIALDNPLKIFSLDASANQRLSHVYMSMAGFLENYGIPHGFFSWPEFYTDNIRKIPFFWYTGSYPRRIMSGYGSAFFELGLFGLLLLLFINSTLIQIPKRGIRHVVCVFFNLIMVTAVPLAFPLTWFLIGIIIFESQSIRYIKKLKSKYAPGKHGETEPPCAPTLRR